MLKIKKVKKEINKTNNSKYSSCNWTNYSRRKKIKLLQEFLKTMDKNIIKNAIGTDLSDRYDYIIEYFESGNRLYVEMECFYKGKKKYSCDPIIVSYSLRTLNKIKESVKL